MPARSPLQRSAYECVELPLPDETIEIPLTLSERVNQLIGSIKPARHTEQRRHAIADYVRRVIAKCFAPEHKVPLYLFNLI